MRGVRTRFWTRTEDADWATFQSSDGVTITITTGNPTAYDVRTHSPFPLLCLARGPLGAITDPASLVENFQQSRLDAGENVT